MSPSRKILSVVGARPQFVKASPVSRALSASGLEEYLVHTGQHYDPEMSQVFFDELDLRPPALNLEVGSGSHAEQTAKMLTGLERAMVEQKPAVVLVYGDTNSTLAGALAAAKLHLPVAHVEAGLRSFNRQMPEEVNRVVADALSNILFAPTPAALANLLREGVRKETIEVVGDVMFDAAEAFAARAEARSNVLQRLSLRRGGYFLATVHRAENTDDQQRLMNIFGALSTLAEERPVVVPLHPRTRLALERLGLWSEFHRTLRFTEPLGYLDMARLEQNAALVVTDSGGVQKEAYFYRVPCVTLRTETEWVELVELGWNRLCAPANRAGMVATCRAAIGTKGRDDETLRQGGAAERIAKLLRERVVEGAARGNDAPTMRNPESP